MIYLASPYFHADPQVMERRFDAVCRKAGELMNSGEIVYSPIAHNHPIAIRIGLPRGWDYWAKFDTEMIKAATSFMVYRLPGWEISKGIAAELEIAESLGLSITFTDEPAKS